MLTRIHHVANRPLTGAGAPGPGRGRGRLALAFLAFAIGGATVVDGAPVPRSLPAGGPGHLILMGGGDKDRPALERFVALAGGPAASIVILPTASRDPDTKPYYEGLFGKDLGCTNARVLPLLTRSQAMDRGLAAEIASARGIFLSGGDQSRITAALLGTPAGMALQRAFRAGAVVGGTSAGTACASDPMLTGEGKDDVVRAGAPELAPGLGLIPGVIVDQHFVRRGRWNRLFSALLAHPDRLGLGIDEDTAAWVKPDRTLEVFGDGAVAVVEPAGPGGFRVQLLFEGDGFDLGARRPALARRSTRTGRFDDLEVRGRRVQVRLPDAYDREPARRFPMVLALDGQNVFDRATSFAGAEWCLDEAAARLEAGEGLPALIVAVDHGGVERLAEYTFVPGPLPGRAAGAPKAGGGAEAHLAFLRDEVLPVLRTRYRLADDPPALIGSSLGGLFGLWAALRHPGDFGAVAALSPSVWWAERALLRLPRADGARARLWVDCGTAEDGEAAVLASQACRRLEALGWRRGQDLRFSLVRGAVHRETAWAERAPAVLRFLLAPPATSRSAP